MVPNGCREYRLGDLAEKVGSGITPRGGQSVYISEGIPFIRSQNVLAGRLDLNGVACITVEQHAAMASTHLRPLDVLLNISGASIGRSCVVPDDFSEGNVNQHVCIIRCNHQLNPVFLSSFLNSWYGQRLIWQSQAGGNREGLNYDQIRKFRLVIPPLPEQERIAAILSTWDAAITQTAKLIEAKRKLKKGLMQQLLTGKRRFPGFRESWRRYRLNDVAHVTMGSSPPSIAYNDNGDGLPLIQGNADISNRRTRPRLWTVEITKECHVGDIIMSVRAPIGEVSLSEHHGCIGRGMCAIRARNEFSHEYLYHLLLYCESHWLQFGQGSTFTAINSEHINGFGFVAPSDPEEQSRIAAALNAADQEIGTLRRLLDQLTEQQHGMTQPLLTGRVRVKTHEESGGRH